MPKVTEQQAISIAANTTVDNVLDGTRFARSPYAAGIGSLFCAGSAAGLNCELNVGGRSVTPRTTVNAQNRLPVVPDDLLVEDWEVYQGELIQITVQNTTAGALTFNYKMQIEEGAIAEVPAA